MSKKLKEKFNTKAQSQKWCKNCKKAVTKTPCVKI